MKINLKKQETVRFGSLHGGEVFKLPHTQGLLMKAVIAPKVPVVFAPEVTRGNLYVSLSTGDLSYMHPDNPVIPVEAEATEV